MRKLSGPDLDRLIKILAVVLVIGVPLVIGFYWLDRHPAAGPSLADRTVAAAEEAVRVSPNDLGARNHLGAAYVSAKRFDEGIAQFTQILDAAPSDRAALLGRGLAYLAKGQVDPAALDNAALDLAAADFQALADAGKAGEFAQTDPQLEQAYYELGVIALLQGRPADAITNLVAALRINGGDADALYSIGMAFIATGEPARGVAALRKAVAYVPLGWCEPYRGLRDGYTALGNTAGADWAGGMVAMCGGDLTAAAAALQPLTTGPLAEDALLGLAFVSQEQGDNAAAADYFRRVLAIDPRNTSANIGLSQLGVTGSAAPLGTPR
jgi:tetratricopeptide (TPR) repeat protein